MLTEKNIETEQSHLEVRKVAESEWKTPLPLQKQLTEEAPYPLDALPRILQQAITGYQEYGQQPISLIASSALANVSVSCQALANVGRDKHLVSPISMYFLLVASSGERKSAIDSAFSKAARQWETTNQRRTDRAVKTAISQHKAWKMEHDGVLSQIKRASYTDEDIDYLKQKLEELDNEEPEIPLQPTLYFEDCTLEALAIHLAHGWPSAAFWSDEAGIVLGSHSMKNNPTRFVALLNRLWDGKSTTAHRKTSQSFTIENRRLTLNLMMQPLLMEQLHAAGSGINRQSGFMARCLMSHPRSNMGKRFYKEPPTDNRYLDEFNARITDCLTQSEYLTQEGCINLPTILLSKSAKAKWVDFFNQVEAGLANPTEWGNITDFASKAAENVSRLACLFHLFEGHYGDIESIHIEQAIEVMLWHMQETKRILVGGEDSTSINKAERLLFWLKANASDSISQREAQRHSPLRDSRDFSDAISLLLEHHFIKQRKSGKKIFLDINPVLHS
jgi:hypothetical protein